MIPRGACASSRRVGSRASWPAMNSRLPHKGGGRLFYQRSIQRLAGVDAVKAGSAEHPCAGGARCAIAATRIRTESAAFHEKPRPPAALLSLWRAGPAPFFKFSPCRRNGELPHNSLSLHHGPNAKWHRAARRYHQPSDLGVAGAVKQNQPKRSCGTGRTAFPIGSSWHATLIKYRNGHSTGVAPEH
jgi:hypothetical protein